MQAIARQHFPKVMARFAFVITEADRSKAG
jgi:hypothetical protein